MLKIGREEAIIMFHKLLVVATASIFFLVSLPAMSFVEYQPYISFENVAFAKSKKVKVKSYKKKNGTVVKAHKRKAPKRRK